MADAADRGRSVVAYATWAVVCATGAGFVVALLHTWRFSYHPTGSALVGTLLGDAAVALALAAGQGAVALATGSFLVQRGRVLARTGTLALLLGAFDLTIYLLQMAVPATELGWLPDIVILGVATVAVTCYGSAAANTVA